MDSASFFAHIKPLFSNKFSQSQVDGINHILSAITEAGIIDLRYIAYMLATCFHETAKTMQPIPEYGRGKGYDYGKKLKMSRKAYTVPDQIFYGRGLVQLTWFENYDAMGKLLKVDLLNHPDLALDPTISAQIMIKGMIKGFFTGKALSNYFNEKTTDWINARKIINGLDKASLIADYAKVFHNGLL